MANYKNILVAVDLSEEGLKLIDKVQSVANKDSTINLVYVGSVFGALFPVSGLGGSTDMEEAEAVHKEYVNELKTYLNQIAQKSSLPIDKAYVELGKVSTEVKALAEKLGSDLIVIGQHKNKKMERVLGSSATGILHGAPCDVLTLVI